MDGIHDVGGMDGFDDLPADEPDDASPFHADWEALVEVFFLTGIGQDAFSLDRFRYELETQDPDYYLSTPYYERWLTALESLFAAAGHVSREALRERAQAFAAGEASVPTLEDPAIHEAIEEGVAAGYGTERDPQEPAFVVGDRVRVRKRHPTGHTRCPRYVRGAVGEIAAHRGTHVYPDANAHGEDRAEPLYNVRFTAADLWGPEECEAAADSVRIELWEPYLAP
ncbi:MAG: nitrile hydratase subunit beta, partial [Halobaculum sp.]